MQSKSVETIPDKVFLFSGHMIDASDRESPRFPADKQPVAKAAISDLLDRLYLGPRDIAICGGACGGDLLFAEAALNRGAKLEIYLPFDEKRFLGDAGYQGVEKREENLELPVTWYVAMRPGKRKALPNTTEGELLERIEHTKASIRAKIEHPFHVVKNLFRHRKARYKGLAKNTAQLFSLFGFANLMLARRRLLNAHT